MILLKPTVTLPCFLLRLFALALALGTTGVLADAPNPAAMRHGYEYYQIGKLDAVRPAPTEQALMLMGGGAWPHQAFAWLASKGGHGHFVILRASGADGMQKEFYQDVGGVASVQTLVFHDRKAASDPNVLEIVRKADGIFIAGGDQANYVRFWKGTPLNVLLDQHVAAGKPIGGTSAGLAILGGYAYGALDGGSIVSDQALRDPLGKGVTLVDGFLHLPYLQQVITDTHFGARGRLGRLIAFVARLRHDGHPDAMGLGVDQDAALCVDSHGVGRLFTLKSGFAWLVRPTSQPGRMVPGQPLDYRGVRVTGVGTHSLIDMHDFSVQRPAFEKIADVQAGKLALRGEVLPLQVIRGAVQGRSVADGTSQVAIHREGWLALPAPTP
ncbi:MAG TPA: cyanophycinase [Rhodanobacter sp.]|nr:cyanophycinase [Rhodanobacter sp.]